MPIDTGFINAANQMSQTYLGAAQNFANVVDPYYQEQAVNQRKLTDLLQKQQTAQATNSINELDDAAQKRKDIQRILKSSQSFDPQGNLVLDDKKFIGGVEALYPEEAQKIREKYLNNDSAQKKLDSANVEADEKTLQNIYDMAVLGRDLPQARQFIINKVRRDNADDPDILAFVDKIEKNIDDPNIWNTIAQQSGKNLESLKVKNDTRRIDQRDEEIELQRTRANQGQQRINQNMYNPQTGFITQVDGGVPFPSAGKPQDNTPSDTGTTQLIVPPLIPADGQAQVKAPKQVKQQPSTPSVRQKFTGTPKKEVELSAQKIESLNTAKQSALKSNQVIENTLEQLDSGAYTGGGAELLTGLIGAIPTIALPKSVADRLTATQILDKDTAQLIVSGLKAQFEGTGRVLKTEFDEWARANANKRLTVDAIRQLMAITARANQQTIANANSAEQFYSQNGNLRGWKSFEEQEQTQKSSSRLNKLLSGEKKQSVSNDSRFSIKRIK